MEQINAILGNLVLPKSFKRWLQLGKDGQILLDILIHEEKFQMPISILENLVLTERFIPCLQAQPEIAGHSHRFMRKICD